MRRSATSPNHGYKNIKKVSNNVGKHNKLFESNIEYTHAAQNNKLQIDTALLNRIQTHHRNLIGFGIV